MDFIERQATHVTLLKRLVLKIQLPEAFIGVNGNVQTDSIVQHCDTFLYEMS
jgi:hypothetical protein